MNNARACFDNPYKACLLKEMFFITIRITKNGFTTVIIIDMLK